MKLLLTFCEHCFFLVFFFFFYRDCRTAVPNFGDMVAGLEEAAFTLVAGPLSTAVVVTRSHRGHIVRVDAGSGSQLCGDITVGGPTFIALSSSTSLCSLRFCSVNELNHLFKYSHSISVCFSLLLQKLIIYYFIIVYN